MADVPFSFTERGDHVIERHSQNRHETRDEAREQRRTKRQRDDPSIDAGPGQARDVAGVVGAEQPYDYEREGQAQGTAKDAQQSGFSESQLHDASARSA
jgi:hypothetical protein